MSESELIIAAVGIGGVAILSIHLVLMAMLRPFFSDGRWFDLTNVPVALFVLIFLPTLDLWQWRTYGGLSLALATLASITAKKTADAQEKEKEGEPKSKPNVRLR